MPFFRILYYEGFGEKRAPLSELNCLKMKSSGIDSNKNPPRIWKPSFVNGARLLKGILNFPLIRSSIIRPYSEKLLDLGKHFCS